MKYTEENVEALDDWILQLLNRLQTFGYDEAANFAIDSLWERTFGPIELRLYHGNLLQACVFALRTIGSLKSLEPFDPKLSGESADSINVDSLSELLTPPENSDNDAFLEVKKRFLEEMATFLASIDSNSKRQVLQSILHYQDGDWGALSAHFPNRLETVQGTMSDQARRGLRKLLSSLAVFALKADDPGEQRQFTKESVGLCTQYLDARDKLPADTSEVPDSLLDELPKGKERRILRLLWNRSRPTHWNVIAQKCWEDEPPDTAVYEALRRLRGHLSALHDVFGVELTVSRRDRTTHLIR